MTFSFSTTTTTTTKIIIRLWKDQETNSCKLLQHQRFITEGKKRKEKKGGGNQAFDRKIMCFHVIL